LERHGARQDDIAARRSTAELRLAFAELGARARVYLVQAGGLVADAGTAVLPALLPVALVGAMLDRMEREKFDPFAAVDIPQWRRQWLLWRAARRPARMFGRGGRQSSKG
jgi:15-cis-phytoene synthase